MAPTSPSKSPSKAVATTTGEAAAAPHGSTDGTQLADASPQIDLPQRVDAPEVMKTPPRMASASRDDRVRQSVFSPHAISLRKFKSFLRELYANHEQITNHLACCSAAKPKQHENAVTAKLVKEYTMLAASSKRAARHDAECAAYLCLAIVYDNAEEYLKAIEYYLLVLSISDSTHNTRLMGLAYNNIGVNYQLLASANKAFSYTGQFVDPQSKSLLEAKNYHLKHLEITDEAGRFVAATNLGLTMGSLNLPHEAAKYHQEALRLAIRLNSTYGQSLAVGNLGLLASRQNDLDTAVACIDQHLQLLQSVNDRPAQVFAFIQLGLLSTRINEYQKAVRYFDQAHKIAQELGESGTLKQCSCYLGIARARLQMEAFMIKQARLANA